MQSRDPRSDRTAAVTNPLTGTQAAGGYQDNMGVDLGNGVNALVVISATRTKSTVNASTSSTQALAADVTRLAVTIVNDDTVNMAVGLGAAAVLGTNVIAPGKSFNVPVANVTGVINVIWAATGSVAATVLATTA